MKVLLIMLLVAEVIGLMGFIGVDAYCKSKGLKIIKKKLLFVRDKKDNEKADYISWVSFILQLCNYRIFIVSLSMIIIYGISPNQILFNVCYYFILFYGGGLVLNTFVFFFIYLSRGDL